MNKPASDLGSLPHWDLTNIYPGLQSEQIAQAIIDLRMRLDEIDSYMADRHMAREATTTDRDRAVRQTTIDGYLDRMNAALRLFGTLNAYVLGHVATDSYNTMAKRLLFGLGLYAIYQERGQAFVPQYEELLASTGEADAAALALRFGIDIRKPEFWRSSLSIIERRIERYVKV